MTEAPLPDVLRPERGGSPHAESPDSPSFESYFRDPDFPPSQPLAWALGHRTELLDALRGLFHGPAAMVQLRLWCFMELCSQPQARLSRDDIHQLFHAVWPDALETGCEPGSGATAPLRPQGVEAQAATARRAKPLPRTSWERGPGKPCTPRGCAACAPVWRTSRAAPVRGHPRLLRFSPPPFNRPSILLRSRPSCNSRCSPPQLRTTWWLVST